MSRNPQISNTFMPSADPINYLPTDDMHELFKEYMARVESNDKDVTDEYFDRGKPDLADHPIFGDKK